jgi:hypothetical protein
MQEDVKMAMGVERMRNVGIQRHYSGIGHDCLLCILLYISNSN